MVEWRHQPLLSNATQHWEGQEVGHSELYFLLIESGEQKLQKELGKDFTAQGRRKWFWGFLRRAHCPGNDFIRDEINPWGAFVILQTNSSESFDVVVFWDFPRGKQNMNGLLTEMGMRMVPKTGENMLGLTPKCSAKHSYRETDYQSSQGVKGCKASGFYFEKFTFPSPWDFLRFRWPWLPYYMSARISVCPEANL